MTIEEIAKDYHDRLPMASFMCEGQECECCGNITSQTICAEHDSMDFSKDLGLCDSCFLSLFNIWTEKYPGKIVPS